MNEIDFINKYYADGDIFQIGIKDHLTLSKATGDKGVFYAGKNNFFKIPLSDKEIGFIKRHNKKDFSMYFTLNTYKEKTNRKETNINKVIGIFFDIDIRPETVDLIEHDLGTATIKIKTSPSLDKYQLIYLFKEPITDDKEFVKVKSISKALTKHYNTDATFDLARFCRLPFSNNGKTNEDAKLVIFNKEFTYSLSYFEDFIFLMDVEIEVLENAQKSEEKIKILTGSTPLSSLKNWNFKYDFAELQQHYDDLDPVCATPSETDYNMISKLIREEPYKYGDEKIKHIMLKLSASKKSEQKKLEDFVRCIYKIRGHMKPRKTPPE